ncbi:hypothetical protein SRB5_04450 [Streptomyces sp. RB5]|uniref:Uncharacterized protein n=1 Tax=Streptomyces smaragdinus TaxID=2585196 RepID=A0A7K0CA95_9ACTN|nr:hypothetical protein [Streptomyces smaragdinus]MQY10338.1 hypothetical protein [Streptomyces smaragdinus]
MSARARAATAAVDQLPADPGLLVLEYELERVALGEADDDALEAWTVTVVHPGSDEDDEDAGGIGRLELVRLCQGGGHSPARAADDFGDAAARIAAVVFDAASGRYSAAFRSAVSSADGDLLLVGGVELDPLWKGAGLEAVLAAEAIAVLGRGCCAVAVTDDGVGDWTALGFTAFRKGVSLLDLARAGAAELRAAGRRRLAELSAAYEG